MTSTLADINWLLSSLTQASAALIAIVGGLLVSRYVALHAEQQATQRRVADLTRREEEASERLAKYNHDLATHEIDDVLCSDAVYLQIVQDGFTTTVEAALTAAEEHGEDLNQELLLTRLEAISRELKIAWESLDPLIPESENRPNWVDFKRQHDLAVEFADVWEWSYKVISESKEEEARNRRLSTGSFSSSPLLAPALFEGVRPYDMANVISSQYARDHISSIQDNIDQAESEARSLRQERRLASETHEATRQPEGFSLALQVLSVIALLGIAIPVTVMGFSPTTIAPWARVAIIVSFFFGVALLLRFLFVYASFLRDGGPDSLPRSAFGLLWRR